MLDGEAPEVLGTGERAIFMKRAVLLWIGQVHDRFYAERARARLTAVLCGEKDAICFHVYFNQFPRVIFHALNETFVFNYGSA